MELEAIRTLIAAGTAIELDHGTATARAVRRATPAELRAMAPSAGSMGPKAEAAARFVQATGARAAIGSLSDGEAILAGRAGTQVVSNANGNATPNAVNPRP